MSDEGRAVGGMYSFRSDEPSRLATFWAEVMGLDRLDARRAVVERAEAAGAHRGDEHESEGVRWVEMGNIDGNPFRGFAPRPS